MRISVCGSFFFFSSRRRHTRYWRDWSSDVCSSDLYILDDVDEDNVVTSIKKTYYHCSKFIVDLEKNLMFLFYNDIISEGEDGFGKGKAITEKKQAFYSLFTEGTQYTLLRFNIHEYLNNYIKLHLNKMDSSDDNS